MKGHFFGIMNTWFCSAMTYVPIIVTPTSTSRISITELFAPITSTPPISGGVYFRRNDWHHLAQYLGQYSYAKQCGVVVTYQPQDTGYSKNAYLYSAYYNRCDVYSAINNNTNNFVLNPTLIGNTSAYPWRWLYYWYTYTNNILTISETVRCKGNLTTNTLTSKNFIAASGTKNKIPILTQKFLLKMPIATIRFVPNPLFGTHGLYCLVTPSHITAQREVEFPRNGVLKPAADEIIARITAGLILDGFRYTADYFYFKSPYNDITNRLAYATYAENNTALPITYNKDGAIMNASVGVATRVDVPKTFTLIDKQNPPHIHQQMIYPQQGSTSVGGKTLLSVSEIERQTFESKSIGGAAIAGNVAAFGVGLPHIYLQYDITKSTHIADTEFCQKWNLV